MLPIQHDGVDFDCQRSGMGPRKPWADGNQPCPSDRPDIAIVFEAIDSEMAPWKKHFISEKMYVFVFYLSYNKYSS